MVSRLQTKASQIGNILQSLEKKYESKLIDQQHHGPGSGSGTGAGTGAGNGAIGGDRSPNTRRQQNLEKFEALTKKHKQDAGPPMKRMPLKMDAFPPFDPSKYRKSPRQPDAPNTEELQQSKDAKTPTSAKSLNDELAEAAAAVTQHFGVDASQSDYVLCREQAADGET